jgi:hypothetical protein
MTVSINGTSGLVFNDASTQNTAATGFGFKNRIINGAMVIDQRNAGASQALTVGAYTIDRFVFQQSSGTITFQQTTSQVPVGFAYSESITVTSVGTRNSTDYFNYQQIVEGFNWADLGWGSANAATVTLSFWVRSSVTGTYSGVIQSGDNTRAYAFTYSIPSANTWTQISVTVAGDVSGGTTAYPINNTAGLRLKFDLGSGSNYQMTAGSWQAAANKIGVSGTASWAQTAGATFYITGVQLEKGSTATSFDYRPYGTELALCQRYFEILRGGGEVAAVAMGVSTTSSLGLMKFAVTKRAAPTMASSATASNFLVYTGAGSITASAVPTYSINAAIPTINSSPLLYATAGSMGANQSLILMILGSSSDFISASSEL